LSVSSSDTHTTMPFETLSLAISEKIEALCTAGCQQVNDILQRATDDLPIEELNGYNDKEKQQILTALTNIMSVYNNKKD